MHEAQIIILGGGMLGLLAKTVFPGAMVLDWRRIPPRDGTAHGTRQFGAQYLWKPLNGIPCRGFCVHTTIDGAPATYDAALRYKTKIGKVMDMETPQWEAQFPESMRGYAIISLPPAEVRWDVYIVRIDRQNKVMEDRYGQKFRYESLISTIPLPSLLAMFGDIDVKEFRFLSRPIHVKTAPIPLDLPARDPDSVYINYISDPGIPVYRTTDRQGQRHYEWMKRPERAGGVGMGIPTKILTPGKIWPNPAAAGWVTMLARDSIYCVGRYPAWRPDELVHQSYPKIVELKEWIG